MEINIFEGKISDFELNLEIKKIAELVIKGYKSGEIFADSGTLSKTGYRGWWEK